MGSKERTAGPPIKAASTRKGQNEEEDPERSEGLRAPRLAYRVATPITPPSRIRPNRLDPMIDYENCGGIPPGPVAR